MNFYIPLIQEIKKSQSPGLVSVNFFVKPSNKYNCILANERNLKLFLNCQRDYKFNIFEYKDIEKTEHSGVCFCVEGTGLHKKLDNQKVYSFINKVDFVFHTVDNPSNSNKMSMLGKVDYMVYPSREYALYFNREHEKNLYLGISRYSKDPGIDASKILKKYSLPDNQKYATVIYPHYRDLNRTSFPIVEMYNSLREKGYAVLVKNRSKNYIKADHLGDYYFEDYSNSITVHPHRTDELIHISDLIVNFGSTTIEESLFLKKPVINFNLKSFYHMANKDITPERFAQEQDINLIDCKKPALDFIYEYSFVRNLSSVYQKNEFIEAINYCENKEYFKDSFEDCWSKYYSFDPSTVSKNILKHAIEGAS